MNADPKGYEFFDMASQRTMKLVYEDGPYKDWIIYRHPDGQWVSLRKATAQDWGALSRAMSAQLHAE